VARSKVAVLARVKGPFEFREEGGVVLAWWEGKKKKMSSEKQWGGGRAFRCEKKRSDLEEKKPSSLPAKISGERLSQS